MKTVLLVIDSFGIGALPDAADYGDAGSATAAGIGRALNGVNWPNLQAMGLGNAAELAGNPIPGCPAQDETTGVFAAMAEKSPGKGTTTGHWELAGIVLDKAFPVFPADFPSFPEELVEAFVRETGMPGILGNKAASGTAIIEELGEEHLKTRMPICYTSADSVFQIACHESICNKEELYRLCDIARGLCDKYNVGRVIARPFTGETGNFSRTKDRHDWSIALPGKTLLDHLRDGNVETVAVGKIGSIFNEQGIDVSCHDAGNPSCMERTLKVAAEKTDKNRFIFVNLVDTDMVYGHRRDPKGYHDAVAVIDSFIPRLEEILDDGDILAVTGDHGCDPTFRGTDHTREYVAALIRRKGEESRRASQQSRGVRSSFADLAVTLQSQLGLRPQGEGKEF